ncbi:MAG: NADP-dependent oxidoreductase [Actinobacteria bacterium]|nr:NADP-dependent oxidoreductase [Actinomycetota bacterium]
MRAIGIHEFGGRDKLQLLDLPEPKVPPDFVKIRLRAAGVNPVDWKLREGRLEPRFPVVFPVVPGWDAAGVVAEVGPAVTEFALGDEVYSYCRKHFIGEGTYAEYVSVPDVYVARKPESLSFEQAAAIPLAGLTAYQALFLAAGLTAGERVLVSAAAGGVGSFAVQLAIDAGAEVIGVAREQHRDRVLELGAYEVIDRSRDVAEAVRELVPDGVDVVFDLYGDERLGDAVRDGGRIVSIASPPSYSERDVVSSYVFVRPDGEQLEELAALTDDGRLLVDIAEVLPLEDAARAHELSADGHVRGKLVLRIS